MLRPGGRLIVAVDHPYAVDISTAKPGASPTIRDLQPDRRVTQRRPDRPDELLDRPLHAMTDAFTAAGFRIAVISEPPPAPGARELFPDQPRGDPGAFLCFRFFGLQAD